MSKEIILEKFIRCPICGYEYIPESCDSPELFTEGEHEVWCHECDHSYFINTGIAIRFDSPARILLNTSEPGQALCGHCKALLTEDDCIEIENLVVICGRCNFRCEAGLPPLDTPDAKGNG